jgi:hypothetical protein
MKKILTLVCIALIVTLWNYLPYSYFCFDYLMTGCDDWAFWWNLPKTSSDYKGVKWGVYFTFNGIGTVIILYIYGKLIK